MIVRGDLRAWPGGDCGLRPWRECNATMAGEVIQLSSSRSWNWLLKQVDDGLLAEAPGCDGRFRFIVLDHDTVVLVNGYDGGGARARPARWKISMMTMRAPQLGHGGRRSGGEAASATSVRAGSASNFRARATLSLRPALARKP